MIAVEFTAIHWDEVSQIDCVDLDITEGDLAQSRCLSPGRNGIPDAECEDNAA